jgi:hypothetical protein
MATWRPISDKAKCAYLRQQVFQMWGMRASLASPCPLPVSLSKENLATIMHQPYVVAPKHDGVRHLLLLTQYPKGVNIAVLITRNWTMYPLMVCGRNNYFKLGSLFDGELVREGIEGKEGSGGPFATRLMYRVFDVVSVAGTSMVGEDYNNRYSTLQKLFFSDGDSQTSSGSKAPDYESLYDPKNWATVSAPAVVRQSGKLVPCGNAEYLGFRCKRWYTLQELPVVLAVANSGADGLIFMPLLDGVCCSRKHTRMFKWKTCHSIDLKTERLDGCIVLKFFDGTSDVSRQVKGVDGYLYDLKLTGDTIQIPKEPSVCEFAINHVETTPNRDAFVHDVFLRFLAVRTDKANANHEAVIACTIDNFVNPVTEDMLKGLC